MLAKDSRAIANRFRVDIRNQKSKRHRAIDRAKIAKFRRVQYALQTCLASPVSCLAARQVERPRCVEYFESFSHSSHSAIRRVLRDPTRLRLAAQSRSAAHCRPSPHLSFTNRSGLGGLRWVAKTRDARLKNLTNGRVGTVPAAVEWYACWSIFVFGIAIPTDKLHTRRSVREDMRAASALLSENLNGEKNRRAMPNRAIARSPSQMANPSPFPSVSAHMASTCSARPAAVRQSL